MNASETSMMSADAPAFSRARVVVCVGLLVLLGFSLGCSEFVVIGIETELSTDLGVSLSTVGQLIALFSLPYAIMTPVLALSTGRFKRFTLLVVYCAVFCIGNAIQAFASGFAVLLAARIIMGSVSGALLAVGVTYIPELLDAKKMSFVISAVYAAFSVAMILATSAGKALADGIGWRYAFYATLAFAVVISVALIAAMPRQGKTDAPATFSEQLQLLKEPAILTGMVIFVFGVGSVYVFYGYVTPYLEQMLGMSASAVSGIMLVYGALCLASNLIGGWIDARFGMRAIVVTFVLQAAALLGLWLAGAATVPALVMVFAIALLMYLFSVSVISMFMQIAYRRHPQALTLASSLEPMAFNVGISFGTVVGGAVVAGPGIAQVGVVGAVFALVACALVVLTCRLAARKGDRF